MIAKHRIDLLTHGTHGTHGVIGFVLFYSDLPIKNIRHFNEIGFCYPTWNGWHIR